MLKKREGRKAGERFNSNLVVLVVKLGRVGGVWSTWFTQGNVTRWLLMLVSLTGSHPTGSHLTLP